MGLQRLELLNVSASDGSLAPLARLRRLERLFLPATPFEVEEFARLAATLPKARPVRADWLSPVFCEPSCEVDGHVLFPCRKCGKSRVLLTGKGTRMACPTRDARRIEQHIARGNAARRPFD
jgi:hypothetical protein